MMHTFHWSTRARADMDRHVTYRLKTNRNVKLALSTLKIIDATEELLSERPRIGTPLPEFANKEARKILLIDRYEVRYEIKGSLIIILRVYHNF